MTHQLQIAERIAQLRRKKQFEEKRDIAQTELAEVIGATPETYSRYENGKRKVPDEAIFALANYYGVTPGFIRYGEPPGAGVLARLQQEPETVAKPAAKPAAKKKRAK